MSLNLIQASGSYSGNSSSQTFTIGWQPGCVFIINDKTTGPQGNRAYCVKISPMADDDYMSFNQNAVFTTTGGITLTSTGFSVGANDDINDTGSNYYWTACRAGPWFDMGTYSGTGGSQGITLNRQPQFVLLCEDGSTDSGMWKSDQRSGAEVARKTSTLVAASACTLSSTGFTASDLGSTSGSTYYYLARYAVVGSTRHYVSGTYTGNGGTQAVTLGFQPQRLLIENGSSIYNKFPDMAGTSYSDLGSAHTWSTGDGITITSTGFSLGSVGPNATDVIYNYIASQY